MEEGLANSEEFVLLRREIRLIAETIQNLDKDFKYEMKYSEIDSSDGKNTNFNFRYIVSFPYVKKSELRGLSPKDIMYNHLIRIEKTKQFQDFNNEVVNNKMFRLSNYVSIDLGIYYRNYKYGIKMLKLLISILKRYEVELRKVSALNDLGIIKLKEKILSKSSNNVEILKSEKDINTRSTMDRKIIVKNKPLVNHSSREDEIFKRSSTPIISKQNEDLTINNIDDLF